MTNEDLNYPINICPELDGGLAQGLLIRRSQGEPDYQTWKRFVSEGYTSPGLDPILANSWQRCLAMQVDPTLDHLQAAPRSPNNKFEIETLGELVTRLDPRVLNFIKNRDLILAITDANGRFVYRSGRPQILARIDRIGFVVNADWSENSVGTNAIGTALAEGYPVQIFGREHFRTTHQSFRCTAAPFFSPSGQVMGCVDLSSGLDVDHSHNLELAIGIARFFERMLLQAYAKEMQCWPQTMLEQIKLNRINGGGLLAVEANGQICGADDEAVSMLGLGADLVGRPAAEIFDLQPLTSRPITGLNDQVQMVRTVAFPMLYAEIKPLWSPSGLWQGYLIQLQPPAKKQATTTINRYQKTSLRPMGQEKPWVILGDSQATETIRRQCGAFAMTPSTVFITGESGTGKERVAHALHALGPRNAGPFIAVNCGALPAELIQSELFGYAPGAFTGADRKGRAGVFEQADHGVLFLDEIGELPLRQQANLLRVLEEGQVTRVGGNEPKNINVKIVAASNKNLLQEAAAGRFREDLFYRLSVTSITLPPLRERPEDILPIAEYHLARLIATLQLPPLTIGPEVKKILTVHPWPGNVRTLVNAMEYACNQYYMEPFEEIKPDHLPPNLLESAARQVQNLESIESTEILKALKKFNGNISKTAKALGIGRNTLYAKLKKYGQALINPAIK